MPATIAFAIALAITGCGDDESSASGGSIRCQKSAAFRDARVPVPKVDRFDEVAACQFLREQVELGPRPAGSRPSRVLARRLLRRLPNSHYQRVDDAGRLRNVLGRVWGRHRVRQIIVGAHYDTKDLPGFVGANDGAAGTAVLAEIAQSIKASPRLDQTVTFLFFDGEEAPAGVPDSQFERYGLRGSRSTAPAYVGLEAFILLDFVGERGLRIPREANSNPRLWRELRAAARRVGVGKVFPPRTTGAIIDDHVPFIRQRIPSIDLIDFDYRCWHKPCDDLSQISVRSLDATGETVLELLRTLSRDGPRS